MGTSIYTTTTVDDGLIITDLHPTHEAAEAHIRALAKSALHPGPVPSNFDEVVEALAANSIDIDIASHPLRSVATDLTGIDRPLLARQARDLATIIGRCDDDADNTVILITHTEAESLEGVLSLALSILETTPPA